MEDPDELQNVVDEPANKEVVKALRQSLIGFVKSTPGFFADIKASIEVRYTRVVAVAGCVWGIEVAEW